MGCPYEYESMRIPYEIKSKYIPDFTLPNGIIIEAKGRLLAKDARKHRAVKNQHPELDIRFVFMSLRTKVEGSKFSNKQWCERYKFKYAEGTIPKAWLTKIKKNGKSIISKTISKTKKEHLVKPKSSSICD